MNAITGNLAPAIQWPDPIINDPHFALEQAGCLIERLYALHSSTTADLNELLVENSAMPEHLARTAWNIFLIYTLTGEKLAEIDRLIQRIIRAGLGGDEAQWRTSVGKHVAGRQRTDWAEAVQALNEAEAAPGSDEDFDRAGAAFKRMVATRVPNLRCLHEKATIINNGGNWLTDGVADSLLADIEHLTRKHEIAGRSAAQAEG